MDTASQLEFARIAIVALIGAAVLLWRLPGPCVCDKCAFHVNEARVKREKQRVSKHQFIHKEYRIPWGDGRCSQCRLGHDDDQHVVD